VILTQAMRTLAGPATGGETYYSLLAGLPWMEAGAALTVLALGMALLGGRARPDRRVTAVAVAAAAGVALTPFGLALGPAHPMTLVLALNTVVAIGLSLAPGLAARTTWGGWTGLIALVLGIGAVAQAFAPATAFLFLWPGLLAAAVAALAAWLDPGLTRPRSLGPVAAAGAVGGAWLIGMAHPIFLGIGLDLPGVLVLIGLLVMSLVRPLSPERGAVRPWLMAALAVLVLAGGLSLAARTAEPAPPDAHG
jgi:hypothetical protein